MTHPNLDTARTISKLLDNQFSILGIKFGLDALLGLLPGLGDILTMIFSLYLIWIGINLKLSYPELLRMVWNILLDVLIGGIPVLGDLGDIFFRSNQKNLRILENHQEKLQSQSTKV